MRRPSLLCLLQRLPYPTGSGVNVRAFHVLRLLSREFDVTALCFARPTKGYAAVLGDCARMAVNATPVRDDFRGRGPTRAHAVPA
jgi:hypothetical protein